MSAVGSFTRLLAEDSDTEEDGRRTNVSENIPINSVTNTSVVTMDVSGDTNGHTDALHNDDSDELLPTKTAAEAENPLRTGTSNEASKRPSIPEIVKSLRNDFDRVREFAERFNLDELINSVDLEEVSPTRNEPHPTCVNLLICLQTALNQMGAQMDSIEEIVEELTSQNYVSVGATPIMSAKKLPGMAAKDSSTDHNLGLVRDRLIESGGGVRGGSSSGSALRSGKASTDSEESRQALVAAVKFEDYKEVQTLLENGQTANFRTKGWTPLMYAVLRNNNELAELLLDHGADINATNEKLDTALHLAAAKDSEKLVKLLLKKGADKTLRNAFDNLAVVASKSDAVRGLFKQSETPDSANDNTVLVDEGDGIFSKSPLKTPTYGKRVLKISKTPSDEKLRSRGSDSAGGSGSRSNPSSGTRAGLGKGGKFVKPRTKPVGPAVENEKLPSTVQSPDGSSEKKSAGKSLGKTAFDLSQINGSPKKDGSSAKETNHEGTPPFDDCSEKDLDTSEEEIKPVLTEAKIPAAKILTLADSDDEDGIPAPKSRHGKAAVKSAKVQKPKAKSTVTDDSEEEEVPKMKSGKSGSGRKMTKPQNSKSKSAAIATDDEEEQTTSKGNRGKKTVVDSKVESSLVKDKRGKESVEAKSKKSVNAKSTVDAAKNTKSTKRKEIAAESDSDFEEESSPKKAQATTVVGKRVAAGKKQVKDEEEVDVDSEMEEKQKPSTSKSKAKPTPASKNNATKAVSSKELNQPPSRTRKSTAKNGTNEVQTTTGLRQTAKRSSNDSAGSDDEASQAKTAAKPAKKTTSGTKRGTKEAFSSGEDDFTPEPSSKQNGSLKRAAVAKMEDDHDMDQPKTRGARSDAVPKGKCTTVTSPKKDDKRASRKSSKTVESLESSKKATSSKSKLIAEEEKVKAEKVVAIANSVSKEAKTSFLEVADGLGYESRGDLEDDVTHFVVGLDGSNNLPKRTVKILKAMLLGSWIISEQWLKLVTEGGKKVPAEKLYQIKGTMANGARGGPARARENIISEKPGLFAECKFYFRGLFKRLSKDELKELVTLGGGTMLDIEPSKRSLKLVKSDSSAESTVVRCRYFIVSESNDPKQTQTDPQDMLGYGCAKVTGTWICDSVELFALVDIADPE